jgi:hypothetical protein
MQIDVKEVDSSKKLVTCNLYTGERCVKIYMSEYDYKELIRDNFFIRDGKQRDSANVLNTTLAYEPAIESNL